MRSRLVALLIVIAGGCARHADRHADPLPRHGDEVVVAGRLVRTGTPVVLWADPGGHDAYAPSTDAAPATQPVRNHGERSGTPGVALRDQIDQFVLHYDVAGTSASCFGILQARNLSVHFLLDLDGTIYQTLDLRERAFHATKSNDRSVGIEIANIGSYDVGASQVPLQAWYKRDADGRTYVAIPERLGGLAGQRTKPAVLRPTRDAAIVGPIQGRAQRMYDLTPQQYVALAKLAATLAREFPRVSLDCPRDERGAVLTRALDDDAWRRFRGVLGHHHVQANKSDPGPAFQWDRFIADARRERATRSNARPVPSPPYSGEDSKLSRARVRGFAAENAK